MLNRSNQRINYFKYITRKTIQSSESPFLFAYGRTALKAGLRAYNIQRGKKVLIPNYICDAVLEPFFQLGISIQYYSVKENLSPDWQSVKENLSKETAAILMVHYFGIPQDINSFTQFAHEHNLLLIEDNSHGHGSLYNNQLVGTFGEIGISSPRKSFPILNGGILFLKNKKKPDDINFLPEPIYILKLIIRDIAGRILDSMPAVKEFFLQKTDSRAEWNAAVEDWAADKTTIDILEKYNLKEVREKRTAIYKVWGNWCIANKLSPIFPSIINSIAPLSLPLLFDTKKERDKWLAILNKNHIAAYLWPYLPKEIMATANSGRDLSERILCIPIHLSMNADKLEKYLFTKFIFNT